MEHRIEGVVAQTLHLKLGKGESCWASRGGIVSLEEDLMWRLRLPGGVAGAIKRGLAGENFALNHIESSRAGAEAVLGSNQAGKIALWDLAKDGPVLATRGAFLAACGDVDITIAMARRVGAMFFGGAGLFLQKMSGASGQVFIYGAGDFMEHRLAPGQKLLVSTGNLAAFSESVDYRIRGVGGCMKMLFGGEGIFMTEMMGPGRVLIQSLKRQTIQAAKAAAMAGG